MEVVARSNSIRTSPRKLRLVRFAIAKITNPQLALTQLRFMDKRAGIVLAKVIKAALANATHNSGLKEGSLMISRIDIDEGPRLKRYRAGSRGTAKPILKRTSRIRVVLEGEK